MRFGINRLDMSSVAAFAKSAARAEALGYDLGCIPSSPLLVRDPYVMIAAALTATQRMSFVPLIENPVMRDPAVIAGSIATLADFAPHRVLLGLGVGDTAVRLMGKAPASVQQLANATNTIRTLLAGESLPVAAARPARLRHAAQVPVWVAAQGDRTLRMAGGCADGVFLRVGTHPEVLRHAYQQVCLGAAAAQRPVTDVKIGLVLHTLIAKEQPSDEERCTKVARAIAAGYFEYSPKLFATAGFAWTGTHIEQLKAQVWPDFHHAADLYRAGELVSFLSNDCADAFSLNGSGNKIRAQLDGLLKLDIPIECIVLHPVPLYPAGQGPRSYAFADAFAHMASEIIAHY